MSILFSTKELRNFHTEVSLKKNSIMTLIKIDTRHKSLGFQCSRSPLSRWGEFLDMYLPKQTAITIQHESKRK